MSERQTKAGKLKNLQTCTFSFTHSGHSEQLLFLKIIRKGASSFLLLLILNTICGGIGSHLANFISTVVFLGTTGSTLVLIFGPPMMQQRGTMAFGSMTLA